MPRPSSLCALAAGALVSCASGCASMSEALWGAPMARGLDGGYDAEAPREAPAVSEAGDAQQAWVGDGDDEGLLAWGGPQGGAAPPGPAAGGGQADPAGGATPRPAGAEIAPGTAVEPGRSQPLLIYTAELHLAVLEVAARQQAVVELGKKLGGFLAYQDDTRVTIRVPSSRFQEALAGAKELGDLLHENVQALDVTEEFRDLATRLRNAEAVRASLEKLLERAEKVEDALAVQTKLGEVTETIERLKGRLRFLEDRIAYSTVTVYFQPLPREELAGGSRSFQLPFYWLDDVGLGSLLDLRR